MTCQVWVTQCAGTASHHRRTVRPPTLSEGDAFGGLHRSARTDAGLADPGEPPLPVGGWDQAAPLAGHCRKDREERVGGTGDSHLLAEASRGKRGHGDDHWPLVSANGGLRVVEADFHLVMDVDPRRIDGHDHGDRVEIVQAQPGRVRRFHPASGGCPAPASSHQLDPDRVRAPDDQLVRD